MHPVLLKLFGTPAVTCALLQEPPGSGQPVGIWGARGGTGRLAIALASCGRAHQRLCQHAMFKLPDFNDRAKTAAEARQAKLDKFKKAGPPSEEALAAAKARAEKRAQKEAEAKAARAERARQMAEEKAAREAQREKQAEQARLEAISREAAQKAARDARYAARKARVR
jgi:hypothetical protein